MFAIRARNFKCFGDDPQGFEGVKVVNLIIGRNNSGKSSLLDLLHLACQTKPSIQPAHGHLGNPPEVLIETLVGEKDMAIFPSNMSGGAIIENHGSYGRKFLNGRITVRLGTKNHEFVAMRLADEAKPPKVPLESTEYAGPLSNTPSRNPFATRQFWRLKAERDIAPESDVAELSLSGDGKGATNLIQNFLNKSHLPSEVIEQTLLAGLNEVFNPDVEFTHILCQQHVNGLWEIYLSEKRKVRIALSESGSGLKTVILVLLSIHVLPRLSKKAIKEYVFAYEELENNLHPALQRRLLTYVAGQARANQFLTFITTHSSVAIDLFARQADAQILHVLHDGRSSRCSLVQAYVETKGILDDLDVRASDLLQSNGVIWVEGPSDRIYLRRWIELWSNGLLQEGLHYQCVFYGGRLLAHLSGKIDDDSHDEGVSILRVNRNAAVVIDSDRRCADDDINKTKKRIRDEIAAIDGMAWITTGREIENYVSHEVLTKWLVQPVEQFNDSLYGDFFTNLEKIDADLGTRYRQQKPLLAEALAVHTERVDLERQPELAARLGNLCDAIRKWNNLSGH
jgi:putative ATP-dependent endonuclease of the OLD family